MGDKNSKVKAATRKDWGTTDMQTETQEREARIEAVGIRRSQYSRVSDRVAMDSMHYRNHPIPKGKELFPIDWRMGFADLFYPYAKNNKNEVSPLYLDMPVTTHDVGLCERKLKVLREQGLRYTYIAPGEGELEATMRLDGIDPNEVKLKKAKDKHDAEVERLGKVQ